MALELADEALATARLDPETRAVAARAGGLAELELGRVVLARRRLEEGRDQALTDCLMDRASELQMSLAMVLLQCEEPLAALAEVDAALARAQDTGTRGMAQSQRATILMRLGNVDEALAQSDQALATCRAAALPASVARLLSNRGLVHAYRGEYSLAEGELHEAHVLLSGLGSELTAAQVLNNLGFVAARRGDVPGALALFDTAFAEFERLGVPVGSGHIDVCEVLLAARLLPEARQAAEAAVEELARAGRSADLAEARLMLAEVALAQRDLATARREAALAAAALTRQGRSGWAALARFASARAAWEHDRDPDRVLREAPQLASELGAGGWRSQALEARIETAKAALELGDRALARAVVCDDVCDPKALAAQERSRAYYARALGRMADGDRIGALALLRESVQIAEQHTAVLGATELRARGAAAAAEPAGLGLELVLASGTAEEIFEWSELRRARAIWRPSVLPPADAGLAGLLEALRHTVSSLEQAVAAGEECSALESHRIELESCIRDRSLRSGGAGGASDASSLGLRELQSRLQGRVVVELFELDGHAYVVGCDTNSSVVRGLGPMRRLTREAALLRFALQRLVVGEGSGASLLTAAQLLQRSRERADGLVFDPVRGLLDGATEIVVVPTGSLHAMPWSLLPTICHLPVSVVPSATSLVRALDAGLGRRRSGEGAVVVAGPGVPRAREEILRVAAQYKDSRVLDAAEATVPRVMASAPRAAVLHIAAHGQFRSDNPQFSSLRLADGPLTVYDLELMGQPPELLVLSACDAGRSDVSPGDELMGATAAMLSAGARTIVASVVPVSDAEAPAVMALLHAGVAAGEPVSGALAAVRREHPLASGPAETIAARGSEVLLALAAGSFVCFGAGSAVGGVR